MRRAAPRVHGAGGAGPAACPAGRDPFSSYILQHQQQDAEHKTAHGSALLEQLVASSSIAKLNPKSCSRCRRLKLRCDGSRPCRYCVLKKCEGLCADAVMQSEQEDICHLLIQKDFRFRARSGTMLNRRQKYQHLDKVEYLATLLTCGGGFSLQRMKGLVRGFTDHLYETVLSGLSAMQVTVAVVSEQAMAQNKVLHGNLRGVDEGVEGGLATREEQPCLVESVEAYENECMYWRQSWDVRTMECTGVATNGRCASVMNMTPEELVSRIASKEMDLQFLLSDLDILTFIAFDWTWIMLNENPPPFYRILSLSQGRKGEAPQAIMTKWHYKVRVDGYIYHTEFFVYAVPPEEYDEALVHHPERCRPLYRQMGDNRTGRELIETFETDYKERIPKLSKTDQGKMKLNIYSAALSSSLAAVFEKNGLRTVEKVEENGTNSNYGEKVDSDSDFPPSNPDSDSPEPGSPWVMQSPELMSPVIDGLDGPSADCYKYEIPSLKLVEEQSAQGDQAQTELTVNDESQEEDIFCFPPGDPISLSFCVGSDSVNLSRDSVAQDLLQTELRLLMDFPS